MIDDVKKRELTKRYGCKTGRLRELDHVLDSVKDGRGRRFRSRGHSHRPEATVDDRKTGSLQIALIAHLSDSEPMALGVLPLRRSPAAGLQSG